MTFINDYLTTEEQEMFRQRNMRHHKGNARRDIIVGDDQHKVRCTLDRETSMYLFYHGLGIYDFELPPNDHHFTFVWDRISSDTYVSLILEKDRSAPGCHFLWHLVNINFPNQLMIDQEEIKTKIREALKVFKFDGSLDQNFDLVVGFDF